MSMIKFLRKNVIQKIPLTRLFNLLLNNHHADLPVHNLLENTPKLPYIKYVPPSCSTSSEIEDKSYYELFSEEYSRLWKCLKQVLNRNVKKKDIIAYNQSKGLHQDTRDGQDQKRPPVSQTNKPLPRVLYIQNPLVWLTNKLDFRHLRKWDPNFSETEFTRGARQAVSTITELLSKNMYESLKPLLTKSALLSLRKDAEILWADEVRRNIGLTPGDVQLIIPRKLHFRNIADKKYCDIDMVFIGLKWLNVQGPNPNPPLVFIDIIVRFHRNYSEGMKPDWTISAFKVRRFNIVPQKN